MSDKNNDNIAKPKKKRGRKPKGYYLNPENVKIEKEVKKPKKRGRKPKGGKIIKKIIDDKANKLFEKNIILHLKCSLKDIEKPNIHDGIYNLKYNPEIKNPEPYSYNSNNNLYEIIEKQDNKVSNDIPMTKLPSNEFIVNNKNKSMDCDTFNIKNTLDKLKILEKKLHFNNVSDKNSACFWCTVGFDSPAVYIPKYELNNKYNVYGCFCSPECATAYLMKENINQSTKFERYSLLNNIYCKIYDYKKNIKPAPNPFYVLDKYYGNLTIHEYRKMLSKERLLLIVDKPLTRVLPELHQDNDDFLLNNNVLSNNHSYTIKRPNKNKNKKEIMNKNFGF